MTDYKTMAAQLESLTDGIPYAVTNLANAAALLFSTLEEINWAGFYLINDDRLVLGPFQGRPACTIIPLGKGVCGTSAFKNETVVVDDVHAFDGHIACDSASNSEIVIPLRKGGEVIGVLDIDSPLFHRFSSEDKEGLEAIAAIVEKLL